jgi:hypothetical protein
MKFSEILAAIFACVAFATAKEHARTRKTRAQLWDFAINKWQTAPSPLQWGKVFASGERVSGAGVAAIRQDR